MHRVEPQNEHGGVGADILRPLFKDGVLGRLDILYFGKPGEAESYCSDTVSKYPPSISSGKLVAGAVLLAPVCGDTGYAAVARCGLAESEFQEFPV